jgi:cell division protein FtsQ
LRSKKWHSIIGRTLLTLLAIASAVLLISGMRSKKEKKCSALDIKIGITQQKGFVDEMEVKRQIKDAINGRPEGMRIENFDLNKTELILEQNVWIKNAQLFFDNNEVLHVEVEQRCPVVRLIENTGSSFYLDSTGYKLPLSDHDRANVPVFTNVPAKLSGRQAATLINIATCINADSFLLAQIAQINMLPAGKFEMYPAFGNHVVQLGDGLNMTDKLNRLKTFYQKILVKKGFDTYPTINLAYANQVLVVKADGAAQQVDGHKAVQVFDQMVRTNRRIVNEQAEKEEKTPEAPRTGSTVQTKAHDIKDKPPDIKNKGNPVVTDQKADNNEAAPKAVMPKTSHN